MTSSTHALTYAIQYVTPVIVSDIEIFHEVLDEEAASFVDEGGNNKLEETIFYLANNKTLLDIGATAYCRTLLSVRLPNSEFSSSLASFGRRDSIMRSMWVVAMDLGCSTCRRSSRSFMGATSHTR